MSETSAAEVHGVSEPRAGLRARWESAPRRKRLAALWAPGVILSWIVCIRLLDPEGALGAAPGWWGGVLALGVGVSGPPAFHAAARMLRPHRAGEGFSRRGRHWVAAVACSYGTVFLTGIWFAPLPADAFPGDRFQMVLAPGLAYLHVLSIPTALMLGITSVVWGYVELLVRSAQS